MPKILAIDDDPTIITLLRVNLELEGYDVVSASDGPAGIEAAKSEMPDLILLDVMMPGMDGYAVRSELAKSPETSQVPVIFLSARAQQADRKKGLDLGAAEYLTKPFEPLELLEIIEQVLAGEYKSKAKR